MLFEPTTGALTHEKTHKAKLFEPTTGAMTRGGARSLALSSQPRAP